MHYLFLSFTTNNPQNTYLRKFLRTDSMEEYFINTRPLLLHCNSSFNTGNALPNLISLKFNGFQWHRWLVNNIILSKINLKLRSCSFTFLQYCWQISRKKLIENFDKQYDLNFKINYIWTCVVSWDIL